MAIKPKADFVFEVAYEVVNRVGGAYTVIKSKFEELKKDYGDNYYMIGPYFKKSADVEFEDEIPPPEIKSVFNELEKEGIICYFGNWLISGKPKTILVDFSKKVKDYLKIKTAIKKEYGIDVLTGTGKLKHFDISGKDIDTNNINIGFVWGDCTSKLIKKLLKLNMFKDKLGVLHLHSYPSVTLMVDLFKSNAKVGIVGTMHSTRLGRAIVANGEDLYKEVKEAIKKNKTVAKRREYKYKNYTAYHQLEKAFTKYSDVATAVSEITGTEMGYILGRKADVVTPNGLDISKFLSWEERSVLHSNAKQRIYRFLNAYFLPYYSIDIPNSLLFFTSGRYELTTKGYDILLEALGELNDQLKKENYQNTIFVFLFVMTYGKEANEEILENMAIYDAIEHTVAGEFPNVEKRIINNLVHGHEVSKEIVFDESFLIESKKLMMKFKRKKTKNPPLCAFKGLKKDDPIMQILLKSGLDNKEDDKVKVIFYPAPVSVADGLLSMEYYYVMTGMHLGIFPSMYEPWGYTPLETAAHSVMSITTDIAGFGKFIQKNSDQRKKPGIFVLKTINREREEIIDELTKMMHWIVNLPRKERINKKLEANKLATLANWENFAQYYIKAHNLAIEECKRRQKMVKRKL